MNIDEYRKLADKILISKLRPIGFESQGDHIFIEKDDACFALLRVKDKWSNIAQQVKYLAVVRHNFLPDLNNESLTGLVTDPSLYPFKMNLLKLSKLKKGFLNKEIKYKYESCNLGHFDTADIEYGKVDVTTVLEEISEQIGTIGMEWFKSLNPKFSAQQILEYGNDEYIEKIWSESYSQQGY